MADETCDSKLAGEFSLKCGYKSKQGLKKKWYFNWDDIDRVATQLENKGTKITTLVLKLNTFLYSAKGTSKTLKAKHALSVLDFGNGYIHTDTLTIQYHGENERIRIQELVEGGRIGSIVEKVDGGLNGELSYEVFGFESGMTIIEDNYDSAANSGTVTISVATEKGEEESTGKKLFLMFGGSNATKDWIEANQFVADPIDPAALKPITISPNGMDPCDINSEAVSVDAWFAGGGTVPAYGDVIYTDPDGLSPLNGAGLRFGYETPTALVGTMAVTTLGIVYNPIGVLC
jgi:hypothetical protein